MIALFPSFLRTKSKILNEKILLLFILPLFISCNNLKESNTINLPNLSPLDWSKKMADSEINRRGTTLELGGADSTAKWNYQTGLFLYSILKLGEVCGDEKYYMFSKRKIDSFLSEDGQIKKYSKEEYNIDKINSGKVLLKIYKICHDEKYKNAADILMTQIENHPRTKSGGFWHKKRYPWQMWLDGIYMASPFYAQYSQMFNLPNGFTDVINQILLIDAHTRDKITGLRFHAWDESKLQKWADPVSGCSPNFWGRSMGWYAMALVDILDFIPENYPKRAKISYILNDLIQAIAKYQDKNSGVWYQVIDKDSKEGNYLEASASCMFVYSIAKGINKGYISDEYLNVAQKGYNGLLEKFISIDTKGSVSLNQICSVAGLGGDPYRDGSYEYYISEPVVANDLKGVGPFILACVQMHELLKE